MSITVKVSRSGTADRIVAKINSSSLKFDSDGNAQRDLEAGKHNFSWRIEGSAKQTFNVRIVSPQRAATGAKGTLKDEGVIIGTHDFFL